MHLKYYDLFLPICKAHIDRLIEIEQKYMTRIVCLGAKPSILLSLHVIHA